MEGLRITGEIRENTLNGLKWLKFLTVMSVIGVGICAIVSAVCLIGGQNVALAFGQSSNELTIIGFIYLVLVGLYIYPIMLTFNFISNMRRAFAAEDQMSLVEASDCFRSVLKYVGILTIAIIALYALIVVIVIIAAIAGLAMAAV